MNIFFLDKSPTISAEYMHDVHVRKMIVESAQLLSTANHSGLIQCDTTRIYKSTHIIEKLSNLTRMESSLENTHKDQFLTSLESIDKKLIENDLKRIQIQQKIKECDEKIAKLKESMFILDIAKWTFYSLIAIAIAVHVFGILFFIYVEKVLK